MKIGIVQGRLSKPVDESIQEFPRFAWRKEFDLLDSLGLNHIEWILTEKSIKEGVFKTDISAYKDKISSICCDHLMTDRVFDSTFFHQSLGHVCHFARKNGVEDITIPLIEGARVTLDNTPYFLEFLSRSTSKYSDLRFHLEVDCRPALALILTSLDNFHITFDTGNITSAGYDPVDWAIMTFDRIKNVHLKDRTKSPVFTVEPFTGDTDFESIFRFFAGRNYNGLFTIQTARGRTGKEQETIKRHLQKFTTLYEKFI